ncbi:MAG: autoinducer binding domain-containing protein [Cocleimonas sp.]|nr:autoinducer binding domain-containing protein [Cocleimonas sp.]
MPHLDLADYAHTLFRTTSYEASFSLYCKAVQKLGYKNVLYSFIPAISAYQGLTLDPRFSVSNNCNPDYLEQYTQSQFDQDDYVIQKIQQGHIDTLDWWKDCKNGVLNHRQIEILNIMRHDYKMENGLSLPLPTGVRGMAAASVISDQNDVYFQKLKKETHDTLWTITHQFHSHVITNAYEYSAFIKPIFSALNNTEQQVLKHLLEGLHVREIAMIVFKHHKYIERVVREIRIKIGGHLINGKPRIKKDQLIHYCGQMHIYDEL